MLKDAKTPNAKGRNAQSKAETVGSQRTESPSCQPYQCQRTLTGRLAHRSRLPSVLMPDLLTTAARIN